MDESVKKSKTAYEGLRNLLGADNPTTVKVHSDFAISLFASGKYSESIDMMNDVYDILVKIYGEEHYMIAEWRNKISYMKKYWEYKSVINNKWDELLKIQEKYGESHINSLKAERIHLSKLIEHYDYEHTMEKDYAEYLRILRKILHVEQEYDYDTILRIAEEVYNKHIEILGDEDPGTATCMVYLARIHSLYDRVDLAIELQKKVISIREKTIGADNEITIASIRRLISYYKKIGDIEKSSELEKKLNGI